MPRGIDESVNQSNSRIVESIARCTCLGLSTVWHSTRASVVNWAGVLAGLGIFFFLFCFLSVFACVCMINTCVDFIGAPCSIGSLLAAIWLVYVARFLPSFLFFFFYATSYVYNRLIHIRRRHELSILLSCPVLSCPLCVFVNMCVCACRHPICFVGTD